MIPPTPRRTFPAVCRAESGAGLAGRVPPLVPLALVALALLAGQAFWLLRPTEPTTAVTGGGAGPGVLEERAGAGAPAPAREGPAGASSQAEQARRAAFAPVQGVRLGGDGRLSGRTVDLKTGQGVAGLRVDLLALPPAAAELAKNLLRLGRAGAEFGERVEPIASAQSGADGRFEFRGVRQGEYFLEARGPAHVPDGVRRVRVLPSGEGGPVEVLVRPGGEVVGEVRHGDGRPVGAGRVALYQGATQFLEAARRGELVRHEVDLDRDGRFRFVGLPPGEGYDLTAVGPELVLSHAVGVSVRAGETTRVDLVARRGATVSGRVLGEDPEGGGGLVPVAGALVGPVPRGLRDLAFVEPMLRAVGTRADADGRYTLEGVPPGEFDVAAIGAEHLPGHVGALRVGDGVFLEAPDLVLETGPIVSGRVVDAAGNPVAGVSVRWDLFTLDGRQNIDFSFTPLLYQAQRYFEYPRTDADGRFRAGPLPGDAPHAIVFYAPGFAWKRERWNPERDGFEITVVLERGGALAGRVVSAADGRPVTRFSIDTPDRVDQLAGEPGAWNPFAGGMLFEDADGRFEIEALRPGARSIVVRAEGFAPRRVADLAVADGGRLDIRVELESAARIAGRVVDPEGLPVAGAQVVALDGRGRLDGLDRVRTRGPVPFGRESDGLLGLLSPDLAAGVGLLASGGAISDRDGRFELNSVPGSSARLLAVHRDFPPHTGEVLEFEPGVGLEGVELKLSRGSVLEGFVRDRFGRAVPEAIVIATTPPGAGGADGSRLLQGRSDATGAYRIQAVPAGSYLLLVTRGDEALNFASFLGTLGFDLVTVPEDEVVRFDLIDRSSAATRVFGVVTDGGRPVEGGALTAIDFSGDNLLGIDFKLAQVRRDGSYEFPGLAPGDYQFTYQGSLGEVRLEVDVPDQAEARIDVRLPEGVIAGRVRDASAGEPLANAQVVLRPLGARAGTGLLGSFLGEEARVLRRGTDAEGRFRFSGLAEGEYELTARGPRWGPRGGTFAPSDPVILRLVDGGRESSLEIDLEPALGLAGRVLDQEGEAVRGARVTALPRAGSVPGLESARTDAQGNFRLGGLRPGTYDLLASSDSHADARLEGVEVAGGEEAEVEIRLSEGARLALRVFGPDGRPAPGAVARLVRPDDGDLARAAAAQRSLEGVFSGQGVAGADGRLEFGRVGEGRWRLEVGRGGARAVVEPLVLRDGDRIELRVDLFAGR